MLDEQEVTVNEQQRVQSFEDNPASIAKTLWHKDVASQLGLTAIRVRNLQASYV